MVSLQIEQGGQIAVLDGNVGLFAHGRLGAEGDAEPRKRDHGEVVGTVTDSQRLCRFQTELRQAQAQRLLLRLASKDRLGDFAGKPTVRSGEQGVRPVVIEAEPFGDRTGEDREAAGNECRVGTVGTHCPDQFSAAGHQRDPLFQNGFDDRFRQSGEQRDALAQRRFESDLATHGALGDRRYGCAVADLVGQFVYAFLLDQRGVHVGDQEPLAAAIFGNGGNVDSSAIEGAANRVENRRGIAGKRNLAGFGVRQPCRGAWFSCRGLRRPTRRIDVGTCQWRLRKCADER